MQHNGRIANASLAGVLLGFIGLWLLLDRMAAALGSMRGEAGLAICAVVATAAVVIEMLLTGRKPLAAMAAVGLRRSYGWALAWSLVLAAALICFYPAFALATGASITLRADWYILLPGLFAQGGVAEETVFRGFLFRHIRKGRTFWHAALLSALPFAVVHMLLFTSLDFSVALAAILLSASLSFPLAWLFERSGNSIWPPAIIHFAVQGSTKLIEAGEGEFPTLMVAWMALSALLPWLLFAMRPKPGSD